MKLDFRNFSELCQIAAEAAKDAGKLAASYDRSKLNVEKKETGDTLRSQVVTEADRLCEALILERLEPSQKKYDLGLLTEEREDDGSRFEKDYFWCLDPLDGTLCFIHGEPGYAVSIALVSKAGEALVGVVYDPVRENLYQSVRGSGAYLNGSRLEINADADTEHFQTVESGGAVMNACQAIERAPAAFFKNPKEAEGGGCLWDYAATSCLYQELGAWVSDMSGQPLHLNCKETIFFNKTGVLFATDEKIAKQILASND